MSDAGVFLGRSAPAWPDPRFAASPLPPPGHECVFCRKFIPPHVFCFATSCCAGFAARPPYAACRPSRSSPGCTAFTWSWTPSPPSTGCAPPGSGGQRMSPWPAFHHMPALSRRACEHCDTYSGTASKSWPSRPTCRPARLTTLTPVLSPQPPLKQVFKLYGGAQGFLLATNVAEPDANHAATLLSFAERLMRVAQHVSTAVPAGLQAALWQHCL